MNTDIQNILEDLYQTDPAFRMHEKQLQQIIQKMLAAKPEASMDDHFRRELRNRLLAEAKRLSHESGREQEAGKLFSFSFAYALGGLALVALIVIAVFPYLPQNIGNQGVSQSTVTQLAAGAFGTINQGVVSTQNTSRSSAENTASSLPVGGGVASGAVTKDASQSAPSGTSLIAPVSSVVPEYVYKGESLTGLESSASVLRFAKNTIGATGAFLSSLSLQALNTQSFAGGSIRSFSLQTADGYQVVVDEGGRSISISDTSSFTCGKEDCQPLTEKDVLADETILDIATSFLRSYGTKTDLYGAPEIQKQEIFAAAAERAVAPDQTGTSIGMPVPYVSDIVTVLYPLRLNNQFVYDPSGNKVGMTIQVNIRSKKVSWVFLGEQRYEESRYDAETNAAAILDSAKRGGIQPSVIFLKQTGDSAEQKTVAVEIGKPEKGYVQVYRYNANETEILFVPALIFPITNKPVDAQVFVKSVVVPLVKGFAKTDAGGSGAGGGTTDILPLEQQKIKANEDSVPPTDDSLDTQTTE